MIFYNVSIVASLRTIRLVSTWLCTKPYQVSLYLYLFYEGMVLILTIGYGTHYISILLMLMCYMRGIDMKQCLTVNVNIQQYYSLVN